MRGVAPEVIQELLGHSDIKMTMCDARLTPQVRNEAIA
jgi:site-specific recombinase XerD